jgi:hypothetical protein
VRSRFFSIGLAPVLVAGLVGLPAGAHGQEAEDPLVRRGTVRLEISPEFSNWHSRYGKRTEGGQTVEEVEPLGFDLTRESVGTAMIPSLAVFEERIARALSVSDFALNLGTSSAEWTNSVTRIPIRLDIGVLDWLTVSGMVPLVRSEPELDVPFRADSTNANSGFNPALTDPGSVSSFLADLSADVVAFGETTTAICTTDPTSAECTAAQQLLQEGQDLETSLTELYGDADSFVPLEGTEAGGTLESRVADFATGLEAFGDTATVGAAPLSQAPLDSEGFQRLVTDAAYGVSGAPLEPLEGRWGLGDVELSAAARLLDRMTRPEDQDRNLRYQLGAEGLFRMSTGTPPDPDIFQDLGTGSGQSDVEVRGFLSALLGRRWGLWSHARFVFQGSTDLERRVTTPDVILAPSASRTFVTWQPGNAVELYVAPRYRFTEGISLYIPYRGYRKSADSYTLPTGDTGVPPGAPAGTPPVTVLEEETEISVHSLGIGVVYSTLPAFREGRSSYPMELRAAFQTTVGGSGGQTPSGATARLTLRLFLSFWGDGA